MTTTNIAAAEVGEDDDFCYQVSVPVYVSVYHYGKKGMTRDEVLKAVTLEDVAYSDIENDICEWAHDNIKEGNGVSVFDDKGDLVGAFSN